MGGTNQALIHYKFNQLLSSDDVEQHLMRVIDSDVNSDISKKLNQKLSEFSPQLMLHQLGEVSNPSMTQSPIADDFQKRRIQERVQSFVKDSVLRHNSSTYRPLSELVTQYSLFPDQMKGTVLSGVVDQFTSFCKSDQLASVSRMLDVVTVLFKQYDELNSDDEKTKEEIKQTVFGFLNQVVKSNVELTTQQKETLLDLLHQTDVKRSFTTFFQLEDMVGLPAMQRFLNRAHLQTRQSTSFLMGIRARLTRHDINEEPVKLNGDEPIFSDFSYTLFSIKSRKY